MTVVLAGGLTDLQICTWSCCLQQIKGLIGGGKRKTIGVWTVSIVCKLTADVHYRWFLVHCPPTLGLKTWRLPEITGPLTLFKQNRESKFCLIVIIMYSIDKIDSERLKVFLCTQSLRAGKKSKLQTYSSVAGCYLNLSWTSRPQLRGTDGHTSLVYPPPPTC